MRNDTDDKFPLSSRVYFVNQENKINSLSGRLRRETRVQRMDLAPTTGRRPQPHDAVERESFERQMKNSTSTKWPVRHSSATHCYEANVL